MAIKVGWDSAQSKLRIEDNGTGVTQAIIENHLLKVGSSRYQDPRFREQYTGFSPISRFGIGVLSAFMVADSVEIITCSPDDTQARQISLRSVHGRYLIRLMSKVHPSVAMLRPHGTCFELTFRASASKIDILSAIRRYVFFPRCKVTVTIDGSEEEVIGYRSPKEALEQYLKSRAATAPWFGKTRVEEGELDGVSLAYALRYDKHYGDWSLIPAYSDRYGPGDEAWTPIGTCVEGIAVEFATPGLGEARFLAVANYTGRTAPKTDVARSMIENTKERADALRVVNTLYADYIRGEVTRLQVEEKYSLTYATEQIPYLTGALRGRQRQEDPAFDDITNQLPAFLVEREEVRTACSLNELGEEGQFWLAESELLKSIGDRKSVV